jgi:hypothetical protein
VLHHIGPLAGAALLAGAAGTALFAAIGFVAASRSCCASTGASRAGGHRPSRLRSSRRCSRSSFLVGPALAGEDSPSTPQPGIEQPAGHEQHH